MYASGHLTYIYHTAFNQNGFTLYITELLEVQDLVVQFR